MSEAGFTPGPWHVTKFRDTKSWSIYAEGGRHSLASIRAEDDARLIAAAPELYDALDAALPILEAIQASMASVAARHGMGGDGPLLEKIRAALAKAGADT